MMNQGITVYISAAPDLMAEREALAQMIARLPVKLAWHIVQTPRQGELVDTAALQVAKLFFLIMGGDIQAPVGSEWHMAQQTGRPIFTFLKQGVTHTPAGQAFVRQVSREWRAFSSPVRLSQQVQRIIVEHLLTYAVEYALSPAEAGELEARLTQTASPQPEEATGAGHSAILMSRERYVPSEGVILGEDEP